MNDVLRPYVPEYRGIVIGDDGECKTYVFILLTIAFNNCLLFSAQYIQLQDLLSDFMKPCCVMDCKIGKCFNLFNNIVLSKNN